MLKKINQALDKYQAMWSTLITGKKTNKTADKGGRPYENNLYTQTNVTAHSHLTTTNEKRKYTYYGG